MKRTFRILCAIGLVAAFLAMATAMVLPHTHLREQGHHDAGGRAHACWICQAKAVGVSSPAAGPSIGPAQAAAPIPQFVSPAPPIPAFFLFQEARAPPSALPVFP